MHNFYISGTLILTPVPLKLDRPLKGPDSVDPCPAFAGLPPGGGLIQLNLIYLYRVSLPSGGLVGKLWGWGASQGGATIGYT